MRLLISLLILVSWCTLIPDPEEEKKELIGSEVSEEKPLEPILPYRDVRTTYYNPVESQCDSNPLVTADGSKINLEALSRGSLRWIAISRDLLSEFPMGTKVKITSNEYPEISGTYEVHDVMNARFKSSVDILCHVDKGHVFGTHVSRLEKEV